MLTAELTTVWDHRLRLPLMARFRKLSRPGGFGFNLTVTNNQIIYSLFGAGPWSSSIASLNSGGLFIANGNLLTFSGVTITGVTLDGSSNVPGFTSSNVTFDASDIAIDWASLGNGGEQVVLDVTSSGSSVPEPAEWTTMLAGLAGIGLWRRRDWFRFGRNSHGS